MMIFKALSRQYSNDNNKNNSKIKKENDIR